MNGLRNVFALALLGAMAVTSGCGGGASNNPGTGTVTPGASTPSMLTIGDAPADGVVSFEVTINSVALTSVSGSVVTVLSSPTRVEVSHFAGTFSPLTQISIPQGSYTSATLSFSRPEVTMLNASTGAVVEQHVPLTNPTVTINFSPTLVVGSNPVSINLDLNVAQSLVIDASGQLSVNPVVAFSASPIAPGDDRPEAGEIEDVKGTVQSVGNSSFVLSTNNGAQNLTFAVDANTVFEGVAGLSAISVGMTVEVRGDAQANGSLLASKVDVEAEQVGEAELEGLVVATTGNPATSFQMVVHESEAMTSTKPDLGTITTVIIDGRTRFRVNAGHINLGSVPFATTFDASTIQAGQEVEASTDLPSASGEHSRTVTLHQQALTGTASDVSASASGTTFTLNLAAESAIATLTGKTAIPIFVLGETRFKNITNVSNGDSVRVRGLLFFSSGVYRMAADSIGRP